jgi:PAS domain S-box-containing protein
LDKILNVDNFYIAIFNEIEDSISFPYHVDEMDKNPQKIKNFSMVPTSTGVVIKKQKPMIFYEKDIVRIAGSLQKGPIGSVCKIWLGAPLIIRDRVIGAIVIQSYQSAKSYRKSDLNLLNSVSQHVALALERKESEEKLNDQRQVLEKILESSPVAIALVENRVFKWVNNEMVRMFGYDRKSDLQNKSAKIIYAKIEDYEMAGKAIYNGFTTKGSADYEIDLIRKEKTLFPAHIRLNCGDVSNPMAWTIATISDISQRRSAEKVKLEKQRLQGVLEMAGAVCHEINQPLQAIMGYSEMLLAGSDKKTAANIRAIKSQATRLGKITKKLSNITHYKTVDYPGNTKIVDIWRSSSDEER